MASLLEEIKEISLKAASELQKAEFCTDSEITSLTESDLRELLPNEKLKVRKKVYEKIQQNQINAVFKEAVINDHARLSFLQNLKELKQGVDYIKKVLDAQIDVLEKFTPREHMNPNDDCQLMQTDNLDTESIDHTVSSVNHASSTASSAASDSVTNTNTGRGFSLPDISVPKFFSGLRSSGPQTQVAVKGKMIVSGKTLGRDKDVLKSVNGPVPDTSVYLHLKETNCDEESQVTFVFCPVVSRVGSDVQAAMKDIPGDKPVILVVMHHSHTPKSLPVPGSFSNVELIVNVFFHESVSGLLSCPDNNKAIFEIQQQLLKYSPQTSH